MKNSFRIITVALTIALTLYFIWFVYITFKQQDFSVLAKSNVILAIVAAAVLYALIIPLSGYAWAKLLQQFGENWLPLRLSFIMGVTQIGKYVPGNVAQHIGRGTLSIKEGMKFNVFATSVFFETILAIAASLIIGVLLLSTIPFALKKLFVIYETTLTVLSVSVLILVAVITVLHKLIIGLLLKSKAFNSFARFKMNYTFMLIAFTVYCINFLIIGLGIWLVADAMGLSSDLNYPILTAAFTLAWLFGFVTPGAPAGFGVREAVLSLLLSSFTPEAQILALILTIRMVTLLGDGICFAYGSLGFILGKTNEN